MWALDTPPGKSITGFKIFNSLFNHVRLLVSPVKILAVFENELIGVWSGIAEILHAVGWTLKTSHDRLFEELIILIWLIELVSFLGFVLYIGGIGWIYEAALNWPKL